ncbi:hypothetical protein FOZ62_005336 [Perkinsus olseni]|uniref:Uncharacterized protein n=1 Tax=Perkinsus olseni TaxID=32597 RepID=A0A7J6SHV2_PEROL|nr:hypothetical protein FOZ62_005336 [Perkinsus olseni]
MESTGSPQLNGGQLDGEKEAGNKLEEIKAMAIPMIRRLTGTGISVVVHLPSNYGTGEFEKLAEVHPLERPYRGLNRAVAILKRLDQSDWFSRSGTML